jgi:hypothetical protein
MKLPPIAIGYTSFAQILAILSQWTALASVFVCFIFRCNLDVYRDVLVPWLFISACVSSATGIILGCAVPFSHRIFHIENILFQVAGLAFFSSLSIYIYQPEESTLWLAIWITTATQLLHLTSKALAKRQSQKNMANDPDSHPVLSVRFAKSA